MPGPDRIPLSVLAYFTVGIAPTAPRGTAARWSVIEPGRKPRDLGRGLTLTYVAQRHLVGKTIRVRSLLTETGAQPFDIEAAVVAHEQVPLPTKTVQVVLARAWSKDAQYHGASIQGGPDFLVGRPVPYAWTDKMTKKKHAYRGLALAAADSQFFYVPADYAELGHWAEVIACSTEVEGGGAFEALNTYDTATFTFGLIQFGAHWYNDNFHLLLRQAFEQFPTDAGRYFPELRLHENGIDFEALADADKGIWQRLTNKDDPNNRALRRFIKPVQAEVTASEVLFGARMIHWTRAQPGLRKIMVEMAITRARSNFREVAKALDGKGIAVCAAVFDIRLQGRGTLKQINTALGKPAPLDELLTITKGTTGEQQRLKHLRTAIDNRFKDSKVKYDAKTGELA